MTAIMNINKRIADIYNKLDNYEGDGKSIFMTSSFQTQSVVLLKIVSDYNNKIPVYFIDTKFHFPETIEYRNQLKRIFNLKTITISSKVTLVNQVNNDYRLLYTSDTDRCCEINKTEVLQSVVNLHDVWVKGMRCDLTKHRKNLLNFDNLKKGKIK